MECQQSDGCGGPTVISDIGRNSAPPLGWPIPSPSAIDDLGLLAVLCTRCLNECTGVKSSSDPTCHYHRSGIFLLGARTCPVIQMLN